MVDKITITLFTLVKDIKKLTMVYFSFNWKKICSESLFIKIMEISFFAVVQYCHLLNSCMNHQTAEDLNFKPN